MTNKIQMTPWGEAQSMETLAPGVIQYSTAGHGGIWVSPEINEKIPAAVKEATCHGSGVDGWYEEDCCAERVVEFLNLRR